MEYYFSTRKDWCLFYPALVKMRKRHAQTLLVRAKTERDFRE